MTDEHANVLRLLKYVGPVFTFAILFNIPKSAQESPRLANKLQMHCQHEVSTRLLLHSAGRTQGQMQITTHFFGHKVYL